MDPFKDKLLKSEGLVGSRNKRELYFVWQDEEHGLCYHTSTGQSGRVPRPFPFFFKTLGARLQKAFPEVTWMI